MTVVASQWPKQFPAKIAFIGEAPGEKEEIFGIPLVGPSGKLFNKALFEAGISRYDCLVTNVLDFRLEDNSFKSISATRTEMVKEYVEDEWSAWFKQPVESGAYMPRSVGVPALSRLREELLKSGANIVVPLGNTAIWATLGLPGAGTVGKLRGTQHAGKLTSQKVLPTYHPAFILRSYQYYPIFWADLKKVRRAAEHPELVQEEFPEFPEVKSVADVERLLGELTPPVAVDIETVRMSAIDCIGFSDGTLTFTVPFFDNKTFTPYWSPAEEVKVRQLVCRWLESPIAKIFQNGIYDVQALWETWRVQTRGYTHDTRILHRSLWPELRARLDLITSLHTGLPSWKPMKGSADKED